MSSTGAPIRVLHVDDEPDFADMTATFLEREHSQMTVRTTTNPEEGRRIVADADIDCIVSDYDMPHATGIEFLETIRDTYPDLPFILYTGKGSEEVAADAISAGVTDYLQKDTGNDQYKILANRIKNAVTARRSAVEAEQSRYRLEQILKTVPSCVVQLNYDGEFVFANDRAVEVLGLERSDLTSRAYNDPEWEIRDVNGEPIPDDQLPFRQVRDTGDPLYGFRHTIQWPDGTEKILLVNGAPLFDADGSVESVVFSLTDITEQWEYEDRLEQTTARLEALFENSPDMIDVHTAEGTIVDANQQFCEALNQSPEELLGQKVWEVDRGLDPETVQETWEWMDVGDRIELETEFTTNDGTSFPVEVHLTRLPLEDGDRFMAVSRDITEQKQRLQEIKSLKERLELAIEGANVGVWDWDMTTDAVEYNEQWAEMLGYTLEELDPHLRTWESRVHPDDIEAVNAALDAHIEQKTEYYDSQHRMQTADGEWKWIRDLGRIVERDNDGEPLRAVGIHVDIDETKQHQRELEQKSERLEEFASIVSHDLRNPLGVASGYLEFVDDECDSPYIEDIEQAHERMEALIEGLLTLAREGKSASEQTPVTLADLLAECWDTVDTVDASLTLETNQTIMADECRLKQLFENLIRNAVEHGGSDVTITVGDLDNGFYIEDTGIGVPEADAETVFEAGYSTNTGGNGFGLSIIRRIAEAHGWDVSVTNCSAGGARFEVTNVESTGA
ncbi:PAS domain S-box protein [Halosegnis longus]|uniref:PAS domain S-box protein n=1 Tax=Halosegnis longus TaxID=2216012 RepID=UPI00129DBC42|nr:PAS domain S-box protein [Halosegnis longus]